MAQQDVRIHPDKLSCSICSEPLKDPATIPCGHSYCMSCINQHWDNETLRTKQKSVSCPKCRDTFGRRPALKRNAMLADLVADIKKTRDEASGTGTIRKRRASKDVGVTSCDELPKKHKLMDSPKGAKSSQKDNMCSQHNEEKKIFCRTEQQCICYLCLLDKHNGHDIVSSEEEMRQRRKQMEAERQKTVCDIQEIKKDVDLLQQNLQDVDRSADQLMIENEKMTSEMITLINHCSSDLKNKIKEEQISENHKLQKLLKMKEKEKDLLKKRLESINPKKLLHSLSYTQFLEKCTIPSQCGELSGRITLPTLYDFTNVTKVLSQEIHKLKDACSEVFTRLTKIMRPVTSFSTHTSSSSFGEDPEVFSGQSRSIVPLVYPRSSLPPPDGTCPEHLPRKVFIRDSVKSSFTRKELEKSQSRGLPMISGHVLGRRPETNAEFSKYSVQLVLDLNTANEHLTLSESMTKVTSVKEPQSYPFYLDRFQDKAQVLTTDPLPDRCYWEVQWSGQGVSVGLAYNDIKRATPNSGFGNNDKSWVLDCSTTEGYVYRHKGGRRALSPCESNRVGVFLDYKAGILCFYQVSKTNKLIHKVQTTFSQPLYAGLGVYYHGATAKMCVKETKSSMSQRHQTKLNVFS